MNNREREEITDYLQNKPPVMPPYVRMVRMLARKFDLKQMHDDIKLLEELATLNPKVGRKTNAYKELHAELKLRRSGSRDTKAVLEVRQK